MAAIQLGRFGLTVDPRMVRIRIPPDVYDAATVAALYHRVESAIPGPNLLRAAGADHVHLTVLHDAHQPAGLDAARLLAPALAVG